MVSQVAEIYTDGSCNVRSRIGAWVAILLIDDNKKVITGTATETNHNRMELLAVINAVENLREFNPSIKSIKIFSDSQYVVGLPLRMVKLKSLSFETRSGKSIQNANLVISLFDIIEPFDVEWCKVKAHQKKAQKLNYNIEADKLCRKIMRDLVIQESAKESVSLTTDHADAPVCIQTNIPASGLTKTKLVP